MMFLRVILVLVVATGVAGADDEVKAKQFFAAGAKAYAAQDFKNAADYFDEAYAALPMPEIGFSAAQAHRRQYRVDDNPQHVHRAIELYRAYLAKVKTGGRVGDAADNLAEMERELDRLGSKGKVKTEAAVERTRIGVTITKTDEAKLDGATLREIGDGTGDALVGVTATLDGNPIKPFDLVDVPPGDHVIAVRAEGYLPVEKKQRAVQGANAVVEIELVPKPARVKVTTESGAKISVDGRPAATSMLELATGKHVVTVMRHGRIPFGREIVVGRGQELTLAAPLEKTGRRKAVPWVLGGAGALTVLCALTGIAAVVADGNAIDARDQIAAGNASPALADDYERQVQRRDDLKTGAIVLGAGALVAGAVGIGLYLFDTPSPARIEKLELSPVIGKGTAGVSALRRF